MNDDTPTPRETPLSKSNLSLGLTSCPCCNRTGVHGGVPCFYCIPEGGGAPARVVTTKRAEEWRKAHHDPDELPDTDPAPPSEDK